MTFNNHYKAILISLGLFVLLESMAHGYSHTKFSVT